MFNLIKDDFDESLEDIMKAVDNILNEDECEKNKDKNNKKSSK